MEVVVLRGKVPDLGDGDGSGYGSGSGDGSGDGSGYGSGDGYDLLACTPAKSTVTIDDITRAGATCDQVGLFKRTFPNGGTFPDDIDKARAAGLNLEWARQRLGLLMPKGPDETKGEP